MRDGGWNMSDPISRQDAIRIVDGIDTWQAGWRGDAIESMKALPSAQPEDKKPFKLSTVCLLCGKPAVTFSTDDDIPYTNYSYCEDCLRKGLKLLSQLPSAEPEIIHCCECKWIQCNMKPDGSLPTGVPEFECRHWCGEVDPTDFCSYGAKMEDEDDR